MIIKLGKDYYRNYKKMDELEILIAEISGEEINELVDGIERFKAILALMLTDENLIKPISLKNGEYLIEPRPARIFRNE